MVKNLAPDELTRYFDAQFKREVVKIKPGESFATTQPLIIATVLGSCVSACIRDRRLGSAGMNHFMLATAGASAQPGAQASMRYGQYAMEKLIGELVKHGSQRRDLEAKVFGGASVMDAISGEVGKDNSEFVLAFLATEGIETTVADLGGTAPRKVLFFVEDGSVMVKYLWRLHNDTISRREREYARSVADQAAAPAVDLF